LSKLNKPYIAQFTESCARRPWLRPGYRISHFWTFAFNDGGVSFEIPAGLTFLPVKIEIEADDVEEGAGNSNFMILTGWAAEGDEITGGAKFSVPLWNIGGKGAFHKLTYADGDTIYYSALYHDWQDSVEKQNIPIENIILKQTLTRRTMSATDMLSYTAISRSNAKLTASLSILMIQAIGVLLQCKTARMDNNIGLQAGFGLWFGSALTIFHVTSEKAKPLDIQHFPGAWNVVGQASHFECCGNLLFR
jgi:hypothetical protein